MRILLDECIPRKLKYALPEHECQTAPEADMANKKNGVLLSLAERAGFELFLTVDKGLQYEQNLAGRRIAILIVRARSNRQKDSIELLLVQPSLANQVAANPHEPTHF